MFAIVSDLQEKNLIFLKIEDFDAGNLDLKVSPLKFMKPEIKTGI